MKHNSLLFFLLGCLVTAMISNLAVEQTDAQVSSSSEFVWGNVSFTNNRYSYLLFDKDGGEIYSYAENGKLLEIWSIDQLGKNLVKKNILPYGVTYVKRD